MQINWKHKFLGAYYLFWYSERFGKYAFLITILFVIMFLGNPSSESFLYVLVSLLLAILGLLFIFKPFVIFYTRKNFYYD